MTRVIVFLFLLAAAATGIWMSHKPQKEPQSLSLLLPQIDPGKSFPLVEHKSFALILYAHNQATWIERTLRSIFEQEHDYLRVILMDDGSTDGTSEKAQSFIVDAKQEHRVILIRNETALGPVACLYRAIDSCLDREIVIPLDAKDWLVNPFVLSRLNAVYQNPQVWLTLGQSIQYPSYEIPELPNLDPKRIEKQGYIGFDLSGPCSFYAGLFKKI